MRLTHHIIVLSLLQLVLLSPSRAQGTSGSLSGTITHDGKPIRNVTVTLSSPSLQGLRTVTSDAQGVFRLLALPPGLYQLTLQAEGLATKTLKTRINLAGAHHLDITMQPRAHTEEVSVESKLDETQRNQVLTSLPATLVDDLPLGRSVQEAILLAPGVEKTPFFGGIAISGGYTWDSLYLVNGVVTNNVASGQTESLVVEDAIQEITVLGAAISAEYGRFTGGVVSVVTKSGGNDYSGTLRASFANPAWTSASDYGEAAAKSELDETWEATIGGRIVRDALWFFLAGRINEQTNPGFYMYSDEPLSRHTNDDRYEVKLTGSATQKHSVVGSFLSYDVEESPYCRSGCWEVSAVDLDGRRSPRKLISTSYNGILTSNFLVEAVYSNRVTVYAGEGGEHVTTDFTDPLDIALGTWARDRSFGGLWGAPSGCAGCRPERRENDLSRASGSYYLPTVRFGSHDIVAGYERFAESRVANTFYSGSLFGLYVYNGVAPTREGSPSEPSSLRPVVSSRDLILYDPIELISAGSHLVNQAVFLNDRWDLDSRWSFNVGFRYETNHGRDGQRHLIADDRSLSPRLGVVYDVQGDGRLRLNASYSQYVSKTQEGTAWKGGGSTGRYVYEYRGPSIGGPGSGLDSFSVLEQVFAWFLAQGWSPDTPLAPPNWIEGGGLLDNLRYDGTLDTPAATEWSLGAGVQLGNKGFIRVDLIDRRWHNFFVLSTRPGDFVGGETGLDVRTLGNCDDCLRRTYKAVQTQGSYRFTEHVSVGGNYTWSNLRGNTYSVSEYGGGATYDNILSYPEYHDYSQYRPAGRLEVEREHKLRAWAGYDMTLGPIGRLNLSALLRFDSGRPYSASMNIVTTGYVECHPCGYANPIPRYSYFLSERGEYTWEDETATDIAVNWELPIGGFGTVFARGELINAFNEQAVVNGGTGIQSLQPFDPFNETPVEGIHWRKSATFGKATGPGSYQQPRTYRFSVGLRF